MIDFFKRLLGIEDRTFGAKRDPRWREVRNKFAKENPFCMVCDSKRVDVHHIIPFSQDPALELDYMNLTSLCRDHHFFIGHLNSWRSYNVTVLSDAAHWRYKIQTRP